jgi:hypothetical protein
MPRLVVVPLLLLACAACGGESTPTSPTAAVEASSILRAPESPLAAGTTRRDRQVPFHLLHPVLFPMEQGVVAFPPRNEPNAFYEDLQALYRDSLKRSKTALSYVDPEGENVWLTEYFRFYLNGCPHAEAMSRVIAEIRTGATQPVCGGESASLAFPPRNLPYEFQALLESTYRDTLGRAQSPYYVDSEGANVWLAQYLRYRIQGARCSHVEAENKVFAEIRGGGVQPVCGGVSYSDTVPAYAIDRWDLIVGGSGTRAVGLYLTWSDSTADLDLYVTSTSCNGYPPEACTILAQSVAETGTSEQVTFSARSGERYFVWVDNWSFEPQSYQLAYTENPGVLPAESSAGLELSSTPVRGGPKPAGAVKIR